MAIDFVGVDDRVMASLMANIGKDIDGILETTRDMVRGEIDRGIADGVGAAELGDRIEQAAAFDEYRAETIARSETAIFLNRASAESYRAFGVEEVLIIDGDDDPECAAADGQTWSLEDFEANPIEHPNCVRDASPIIPGIDTAADEPTDEQAAPEFAAPASFEEAAARLSDIGVDVDFTGMGFQHVADFTQAFETLAQTFPSEFGAARISVSIGRMNPVDFGVTSFKPSQLLRAKPDANGILQGLTPEIKFNAKYFGPRSADKLADALKEQVEKGWLGGETVQYIIDHEYGHVFDQLHGKGLFQEASASILRGAVTRGQAPTLYGASDSGERFAEAFALIRQGVAVDTPFEEAVKKLIEETS